MSIARHFIVARTSQSLRPGVTQRDQYSRQYDTREEAEAKAAHYVRLSGSSDIHFVVYQAVSTIERQQAPVLVTSL